MTEHLADSPVTANDIRRWTKSDKKLFRVLQYVLQGWPTEGEEEFEPYSSWRLELSAFEGCILWGSRIVIPPPGREAVLRELHEGHPGMARMKGLSRMYVWWPGINADIEKSVRLCGQCKEVQSTPPVAPLNPWRWPTRPWARLHLDFAGSFEGRNILVVIDAHSKWVEATCTPSTSSSAVVDVLRALFARFGLPETVVTDNGTEFVSQEFEEFLRKNGIHHTTSAPYHPASNGLAERAVQIVKKGLKKETSGSPMSTRLAKVLFTYRITPQSSTGSSPTELLLGRRPRTRLDLLRPNTAERVERKQEEQKARHDKKACVRTFRINDVFVKNFIAGRRWLPGKIIEVLGPVTYRVQLESGRCRKCHQDHLRERVVMDGGPEMSQVMSDESLAFGSTSTDDTVRQETSSESQPSPPDTGPTVPSPPQQTNDSPTTSTPIESSQPIAAEPATTRYPQRQRKPTQWY